MTNQSMGSTFTINNRLCYSPADLQENSLIQQMNAGNYYTNPVGAAWGTIGVYMRAADVEALKANQSLTLQIEYKSVNSGTITVGNLTPIRSQQITVSDGNSDSIHLWELGDERWKLANRTVFEKQYNIFSYSEYLNNSSFLVQSTNAGTDWTWETMITDIWNELGIGTSPAFPNIGGDIGVPTDWSFLGVSPWKALHEVLDVFSLSVAYNAVTQTYSFVELGKAQSPTPESINSVPSFDGNPLYDDSWSVPATISVYFPSKLANYGQEYDTSQNNNWVTEVAVAKFDYSTGKGRAGTSTFLWGGQMQGIDENNVPVVGNQAIANTMGLKFVQRLETTRRHRVYAGIRSEIVTGSEIMAVTYRFNGKLSETEYISGPTMIRSVGQGGKVEWVALAENRFAPDIARATYPNYPRLPNILRITGPVVGGEAAGDELTPNANGHYEAQLVRRIVNTGTDIQAVYVQAALDTYNASAKMKLGQAVYGRLSGTEADGQGDFLPVYVATIPSEGSAAGGVIASLTSNVPEWVNTAGCFVGSATIVSCSGSGGEVGETIDVIFPNLNSREPFPVGGDYIAAVLSDETTTPKKYVITSDYSKGESDSSIIVALNADVADWDDTPGCQIVSGDIVACGGSTGTVDETVDIIFPNVRGKVPTVISGDYVAASPTDLTASPKKYVVSSDYSKVNNPGTRPFTLTAALTSGSAAVTFNDNTTTGTVHDRFVLYDYGEIGDEGYAAWVILASRYEIIDFKCDAGGGS